MTCEKHYWYHGPLVDCPHCEIDRLRTELEQKEYLITGQLEEVIRVKEISDNLAIGVASLRTELERAQCDVKMYKSILEVEQEDCELQSGLKKLHRERAEAAEARVKELELALSGKTFSYNNDPEALKAARIAGMEEAAKAIEKHFCGIDEFGACYATFVRARIQEVKNG